MSHLTFQSNNVLTPPQTCVQRPDPNDTARFVQHSIHSTSYSGISRGESVTTALQRVQQAADKLRVSVLAAGSLKGDICHTGTCRRRWM